MENLVAYRGTNLLAYADAGDRGGYPVLVQHGMIASIRGPGVFGSLMDAGARVVMVARPGYGRSSPYEMANLAEWGDIVAIPVEDLNLASFCVLGISSGASYSYALGYRLPDQVRNVFILSGTPALYDPAILAQ